MLHNPVITDMQTEISIMMNYTHQFNALNTFILISKDKRNISKCAQYNTAICKENIKV